MHARTMQNLRRVHIPDSRHRALIQERDLHRSRAAAQSLAKDFARYCQSVRSNFVWSERLLEFLPRKQANISQPAAVPIQKLANPVAQERATKPQVLTSRRV